MIRPTLTRTSLILLAAALTCTAAAEDIYPVPDIYLSPKGSDTWSGTLGEPNSDKNDGPLATLAAARDAVRKIRAAQPSRKTPVIVMLNQGRYELDQTLELGPRDSGTAQSPTIYQAADRARVQISGGQIIHGWTVDPRGWWQARLPEVAAGKWTFMQLFVDGQRRFRPRLPKAGFHLIARTLKETPAAAGKGYDRFGFADGDIKADWANRGDIEVVVFHSWTTSRLHIASVDGNAVTFTGATAIQEWWMSLEAGRRYLVENVKEALGEKGQWYLDRPSGVLTYVPMDGETPQRVEVIAPRLRQLMRLDGVQHVQFEGLTLEHADWSLEPRGRSVIQAEVPYPAAVGAVGIRDCSFTRCVFQHVGEFAIELGLGCKNNRIVDCEVLDTGAGAIKIGSYDDTDSLNGTPAQLSDETVASHNVVRNCLLAQGGRVHPGAVGLWVGHGHHNTLEHNEIYDHYYSGVNLGWSGTYGPHFGHHNDFAFNLVHKIGQSMLNDMGGVYTRGISPGTTIRNNVIRDVMAYRHGAGAVYTDQATTDVVIENNLLLDNFEGGHRHHFGKNIVFRNNIVAMGQRGQMFHQLKEDYKAVEYTRNIFYWKDAPLFIGDWGGRQDFDYNCYWQVGGRPDFAGMTFAQWQAAGRDAHSIVADPLFVDAAKGDFHLNENSPALKIGFKPFDSSAAGRLKGFRRGTDLPSVTPAYIGQPHR